MLDFFHRCLLFSRSVKARASDRRRRLGLDRNSYPHAIPAEGSPLPSCPAASAGVWGQRPRRNGSAEGRSSFAGGDGGKAPRHPAIGMEARKGGDAAGGSVHDSPAAFGGTPAPLTRKKARPLRPDLARYCCWKKSGGIFLPSIRRAMASRMRGCSLSR